MAKDKTLDVMIIDTKNTSYYDFIMEYGFILDELRTLIKSGSGKSNDQYEREKEFLKTHSFEFYFGRQMWDTKIDGTIYEGSKGKIFHQKLTRPEPPKYEIISNIFMEWINGIKPYYEKMPGIYIRIKVKEIK